MFSDKRMVFAAYEMMGIGWCGACSCGDAGEEGGMGLLCCSGGKDADSWRWRNGFCGIVASGCECEAVGQMRRG